MAITIKDIAKAMNVSASTVSRALRGSYEINPETRKAICEYAEKYNYRPNPIAKSLKANKSKAIGIIVPQIANQFFSQAINGIEAIAYNRGYHVIIAQSHETFEREQINVDLLVSRRVDGLLMSLSSQTKNYNHIVALMEQNVPVVFFDRVAEELNAHKVTANNFQGSYDATSHLIQSGYRRIAHVTFHSNLSITRERLNGYRTALKDHSIEYEQDYVKHCVSGGMVLEEIEEAVQDLIDMTNRPDAIFAASDRLTTGSLGTIRRAGLSVPQDMALVGFTNLNVAELLNPSLTSVVQPAFEMGQAATELLIKMIESKNTGLVNYETKIFETKLYIRDSSAVKVVKLNK